MAKNDHGRRGYEPQKRRRRESVASLGGQGQGGCGRRCAGTCRNIKVHTSPAIFDICTQSLDIWVHRLARTHTCACAACICEACVLWGHERPSLSIVECMYVRACTYTHMCVRASDSARGGAGCSRRLMSCIDHARRRSRTHDKLTTQLQRSTTRSLMRMLLWM